MLHISTCVHECVHTPTDWYPCPCTHAHVLECKPEDKLQAKVLNFYHMGLGDQT